MNGVMVLYGGMAWTNSTAAFSYGWSWFSDVWMSLNGGSQWYLMTSQSAAGLRAYGGMLVDSNGYVFVGQGSASWGNWLASAYRSPYSLYNIQQWLPLMNSSISIPATLCPLSPPITLSSSTGRSSGGGVSSSQAPGNGGGSSSSSSLSGGAIAGIVIGGVVGLCLILFLCLFFCKSRSGEKKATSYEPQPEHSQVTHTAAGDGHSNEEGTGGVEMAETQ